MSYDLFICHASEDKDSFVRPLAMRLESMGLRVWYDEYQLTIGDSLRQSIDKGLRDSQFGIVVLSTAFFKKKWPKLELEGLFAREQGEGKVIFPIWHEVGETEVADFSLILAGKVAVSSSQGLEVVVREIVAAINSSKSVIPASDEDRSTRVLHSTQYPRLPNLARESLGGLFASTKNGKKPEISSNHRTSLFRQSALLVGFVVLAAIAALVLLRSTNEPSRTNIPDTDVTSESGQQVQNADNAPDNIMPVSKSVVPPSVDSLNVNQNEGNPFECTHQTQRRETVNVPKVFANSDAACDYYVAAGVRITLNSETTIEPGTAFIMGEDSEIVVNGGNFSAIGASEFPITFKGEQNINGFWRGIKLESARSASFNFVRIEDAGNTQSGGAIVASGSKIDMRNSTISNSYVDGLVIRRKTELVGFSNNQFFSNKLSGLVLQAGTAGEGTSEFVSMLDSQSDYLGKQSPNGNPVLYLKQLSFGKYENVENVLKAINIPYQIRSIHISEGDVLRLEPGVQLAIPEDNYYSVNGTLVAEGTVDNPIKIFPAAENLKPYRSIFSNGSSDPGIVLQHVIIQGGGGPGNAQMDKSGDFSGVFNLGVAGKLRASDTTIEGSSTWAIMCGASYNSRFTGVIALSNMTYRDNALGDVSKACGLQGR